MKILVISQMFPCKRHPTSGIFLANMLMELAKKVDRLIVVTPRVYIPKFLTIFKKRWKKWWLDPMTSNENDLEIIRPFVPFLPGINMLGLNGVLMYYSLRKTIKKYLKKEKIEIIVGHNILPEAIAATRLGKKYGLPVLSWAIGSDIHDFAQSSKLNNYLTKKCLENSNLILATSKELKSCIDKLCNCSVPRKTFYRGIDLGNFCNLPDKNVLKQNLNLKSNNKYILFVGRLIFDKGIYELAEAFINITKKYSDYHLILLGEELEKEALVKIFEDANVLNKVQFKGIAVHKEVARYMKASDLLLFPSWAEGLPNVVIESMAVGLPVVATDVGGIPEILYNEITGLSVPKQNVEKLTEAAMQMIENQTLRENCINNAKKLVEDKFDVNKNINKLITFINEIVP